MKKTRGGRVLSAIFLGLSLLQGQSRAEIIRVATYNLESYLETATSSRDSKTQESKATIRESIEALKPDVIALQELGDVGALLELRESLKREGLDLPFWQFLSGSDTNIHLALLSRYAFMSSQAHTNEVYLLSGRRHHVSRGFAEVDIRVNPRYTFTLIAAHLKSKRALAEADEAEMRLEEAKLLREKIDTRLTGNPNINLVVVGDFNDTKDAASTKAIIGRGRSKLVDTCPAEKNGDHPGPKSPRRSVAWTHYYGKDDTYQRIDYILLSPGMAREWLSNETYVLSIANWGVASDHRPIVAAFEAVDN